MNWNDIIQIPKQMRLMGPGGPGHGKGGWAHGTHLSFCGGIAGCLPNQLVTSPESVKFIEGSHLKTTRAEKIKEEKAVFVKKVLAEKRKNEHTRGGIRGGKHGRER